MILLFVFASCSTSTESTSYISDEDGKETFSFTDDVAGEESHFTAHFDGDRIISIYKDGSKVPADKMDEYSELVYHKLNSLRKGMKDFDDDMIHFSFDMDNFNKEMDAFREKMLSEGLSSSKFHFDGKNLKEQMQKLKEELSQLKGEELDFHFDKEVHQKAMKELEESLKNLHLDKESFSFEFDNEEFKEQMAKLKEELKNQDWENLEFDIPEFHFEMKNFENDMKEFKVEMKKLKDFLKEMRSELVNDNLISNEDEDFDLHFSAESMKINDKEVSSELHNKYKEMYHKHFGKEIEDKIRITE
jgi:chromosome segregation ATPase